MLVSDGFLFIDGGSVNCVFWEIFGSFYRVKFFLRSEWMGNCGICI